MTWTVAGSGTQIATVGTELILSSPSTNATYVCSIDSVNMALGDVAELRFYDKIDGTNYRQCWKGSFGPQPQVEVGLVFPFVAVTTQGKFTLNQILGTARNFPWIVRSQGTWTVDASGSQTAVINTEHVLDSPTTNATYVAVIDTINMALGDTVTLRYYDMIDGTNYRVVWESTFSNPQVNVGKVFPFVTPTTQGKFTLQQTAGTGRVFPWIVRRQ